MAAQQSKGNPKRKQNYFKQIMLYYFINCLKYLANMDFGRNF